jgi:hypothetical protein
VVGQVGIASEHACDQLKNIRANPFASPSKEWFGIASQEPFTDNKIAGFRGRSAFALVQVEYELG